MAYAATNPPVGFQEKRILKAGAHVLLPGVPGSTYTRGNALVKNAPGNTANAGLWVEASDSSAAPLAVVTKTVTCPGATTCGFPYSRSGGAMDPSYLADDSNVANTLIPAELIRGGELTVFHVPFGNYTGDEVLAAYTAATPSVTVTTSFGADDDPNGGIIWIYDGPGAGQWNIVTDYAHGTAIATLARKFEVAPTTASKYIMLEGGGSGVGGVGPFGRCDLKDANEVDVSDGVDDGDFIVILSGEMICEAMTRGYLPVALYSQFV